jgi:pimeloyl-ACP methyl ester carboxylesterase
VTVYSQPVPGLLLREHVVSAPMDHSRPDGTSLTVFAREVCSVERVQDDLPWLLFLQGGPGGRSPRPIRRDGWLGQAVKDYRVLLLDQRGTGLSTAVTDRTPGRFRDAHALAEYLSHFRADAIVRDAELFRTRIAGGRPWTTLGQSYGGFCTLTYLSLAPHALAKCLITGGVPSLTATAEDVYRRTWPRVLAKNAEHFRRYPGDQDGLNRLRDAIRSRPDDDPVRLPGGDPLTVERLQSLGIGLGMSYGSAEIHYLLETAFDGDDVASAFLAEVEHLTSHVDGPLYAVLQEVIYCSGTASRWAAHRVRAEFPAVSPDAENLLLTGEMKEPSIFRDESALKPFAGAMELLNDKADWPDLYDPTVLSRNEVAVAAAIYYDDLYVDSELSLQTAAAVPGLRPWVTNEFEHDGLRSEDRVFTHLHDLATGAA